MKGMMKKHIGGKPSVFHVCTMMALVMLLGLTACTSGKNGQVESSMNRKQEPVPENLRMVIHPGADSGGERFVFSADREKTEVSGKVEQ